VTVPWCRWDRLGHPAVAVRVAGARAAPAAFGGSRAAFVVAGASPRTRTRWRTRRSEWVDARLVARRDPRLIIPIVSSSCVARVVDRVEPQAGPGLHPIFQLGAVVVIDMSTRAGRRGPSTRLGVEDRRSARRRRSPAPARARRADRPDEEPAVTPVSRQPPRDESNPTRGRCPAGRARTGERRAALQRVRAHAPPGRESTARYPRWTLKTGYAGRSESRRTSTTAMTLRMPGSRGGPGTKSTS